MIETTKKNILLLTSDAVGGTLLKNLINVYARINNLDNINDFGHIELGIDYNHETNTVFSTGDLNYSQSWQEIIRLLESNNSTKIGKFSYYNLLSRQDLGEFSNLYEYINQNFYIISCRRHNLFEHAISWCINNSTGSLNVFQHKDKITNYSIFYKEKIKIDPLTIQKFLNNYKSYVEWVEKYFTVDQYYYYEDQLENIENYVLDLPLFENCQDKVTWEDYFDIKFNDWNRSHYLLSNLTDLYNQKSNFFINFIENQKCDVDVDFVSQKINQNQIEFLDLYKEVSAEHWTKLEKLEDFFALPDVIKKECVEFYNFQHYIDQHFYYKNMLEKKYSPDHQSKKIDKKQIDVDFFLVENTDFLKKNSNKYFNSMKYIEQLKKKNYIPKGIPIKKQTLFDKTLLIANVDECIDVYNDWVSVNNFNKTITKKQLEDLINNENQYWIRK